MNPAELKTILDEHAKWARGEGGKRAYLTGADLTGADLTGAYLTGADLTGADLTGAYLIGAYLRRADLAGARLAGARLAGAYLTGADLRRADLTGAYLTGADLTGAYLRRASLNWQSHDLLAEILRQAAGDDVRLRSLAGLVLVSRNWCWPQFLRAVSPPDRVWALRVLRQWKGCPQ